MPSDIDNSIYIDRVKKMFWNEKIHSIMFRRLAFNDFERIEKVIKKNSIDEHINMGLIMAVASNDTESINEFISAGADVDTKATVEFNQYDNCISSVLCLAIFLSNADAAISLIRHGANVHGIVEPKDRGIWASRSSYRPIFLASLYTLQPRVIEELLKHGANPNEYDIPTRKDRNTVLMNMVQHILAYDFHLKVIELLEKHGADLNMKNHNGHTALHLANPAATNVLIKLGAKLDEVDNKGCTPLMLAVENKQHEKAEILLKGAADAKRVKSIFYSDYAMRFIFKSFEEKKPPIEFQRKKFEEIMSSKKNNNNIAPEEKVDEVSRLSKETDKSNSNFLKSKY